MDQYRIVLTLKFSCSQQETNDHRGNGHSKADGSPDTLEAWLASGFKAGPWNAIGYYQEDSAEASGSKGSYPASSTKAADGSRKGRNMESK